MNAYNVRFRHRLVEHTKYDVCGVRAKAIMDVIDLAKKSVIENNSLPESLSEEENMNALLLESMCLTSNALIY